MSKTKILCYGDSNTYGYDPDSDWGRYPETVRWVEKLGILLGDGYEVANEGLNGRTTAYDWLEGSLRNGLTAFTPCLERQNPVDVLIFMLGTNDCSSDLSLPVEKIVEGLEKLVLKAKKEAKTADGKEPVFVLIVPAAIGENYVGTVFAHQLDGGSVIKSRALSEPYRALSEKYGTLFLDASDLEVSPRDCEHLTVESHRLLAERVFELLKKNGI